MNIIDTINFSLNFSALVIAIMLLSIIILVGNLKERVIRMIFILIFINMIQILCEIFIWGIRERPGRLVYIIIRALDYIEFTSGGIQIILVGMYIHEYISFKIKTSKIYMYIMCVLGYMCIILVNISQFNNMFAWVDEHNKYHQGNMFWLYQLIFSIQVIIFATFILVYRKYLKKRELIILLLYPLIPVICYIIEVINTNIWVSQLGSMYTFFLMYVNNQLDLKERLKMQELELAESRISVMLSRIQPHFLYNTLNAIDNLCYDNITAHKAIITFSEYLRTNMDSISNKGLIPFERELEHTKQYLWLEKLRFEERLQIEYHIQTDEFLIPPLILQPIVENAVRHGVTKKQVGGTIKIITENINSSFRITVIDDGVGFESDTIKNDGRSHIGITNVQERLAAMCGGQLTIESTQGIGTTAIIEIPKGRTK